MFRLTLTTLVLSATVFGQFWNCNFPSVADLQLTIGGTTTTITCGPAPVVTGPSPMNVTVNITGLGGDNWWIWAEVGLSAYVSATGGGCIGYVNLLGANPFLIASGTFPGTYPNSATASPSFSVPSQIDVAIQGICTVGNTSPSGPGSFCNALTAAILLRVH
jgi:hypothetical protein